MFPRTLATGLFIAILLAGCSFDNSGIPLEDGGGTVPDAATSIDAAVTSFDAGENIDGPLGAIDAAPFDATVAMFDATPTFDAEVFDATPPDDAPCACDDFIDCTDDQCTMMGCSSVDICPGTSTCNMVSGLCDGVLTFQQGVGGYVATRDTFIAEGAPDTNYSTAQSLEWDADEPFNSGQMTASLLDFNQVFGTGANQVPEGATINTATLTLGVLNGSNGPAGEVREVLVGWGETTVTWNNFGGEPGIQADEVGPVIAAAPTGPCGGPCTGLTVDVDVQTSLQAWSASPASVPGWIFIPVSADGFDVGASENSSIDARPLLTVDFSAPAP